MLKSLRKQITIASDFSKYLIKKKLKLVVSATISFILMMATMVSQAEIIQITPHEINKDTPQKNNVESSLKPKKSATNLSVHDLVYKTIFEKNSGIADKKYQYIVRGRTHTVGLHEKGFRFAYQESLRLDKGKNITINSLDISAVSRSKAKIITEKPTKTLLHHQIGKDERLWKKNIVNFDQLKYQSIFNGVDMLLQGNNGAVNYSLTLAPKADVAAVKFKVSGAKKISIDATGRLVIKLGKRQLIETAPQFFEVNKDGKKHAVRGKFVLYDDSTYGFTLVRQRRPNTQLIIDPTFVFEDDNIFIGGQGDDGDNDNRTIRSAFSVLSDVNLGKTTLSTTKSFSDYDGALYGALKKDTLGVGCGRIHVYPRHEEVPPIDFAPLHDVPKMLILAGTSNSVDFPGAVGTSVRGENDIVVFAFRHELNLDNSIPTVALTPVYTSYIGGSSSEAIRASTGAIAGGVYIAGLTDSIDFPRLEQGIVAPNPAINLPFWGFVMKLSRQGLLERSTLLDDDSLHEISGIEYVPNHTSLKEATGNKDLEYIPNDDSRGFLVVAGTTLDETTPRTTEGAFQQALTGENATLVNMKPFVAKLDLGLCQITDYTYLGGHGRQKINDVAVTVEKITPFIVQHSVAVTGYSTAADFPTTDDALNPALNFGPNSPCPSDATTVCGQAFYAELGEKLNALRYSSFIQTPSGSNAFATVLDWSTSQGILIGGIEGLEGSRQPTSFLTRLDSNTKRVIQARNFNFGTNGGFQGVLINNNKAVFVGVAPDSTVEPRAGENSRDYHGGDSDLFYGTSPLNDSATTFQPDFFSYIGTPASEYSPAISNYLKACNMIAGVTNTRDQGRDFLLSAICETPPDISLSGVTLEKTLINDSSPYREGDRVSFEIKITNNNDVELVGNLIDDYPTTLSVYRAAIQNSTLGECTWTRNNPINCSNITIAPNSSVDLLVDANIQCNQTVSTGMRTNFVTVDFTVPNSEEDIQFSRGASAEFRVICNPPPPPLSVCGDGVLSTRLDEEGERVEACDDGNTRSGDGCSQHCLYEENYPLRGSCMSTSECEQNLVCAQPVPVSQQAGENENEPLSRYHSCLPADSDVINIRD